MPDLAQQIRSWCDDPAADLICSPQLYQDAIRTVLDLHEPKTVRLDTGETVVCRECCLDIDGHYQRTRCMDDHDPDTVGPCWPCPTITALAAALGIEVPS